MPSLHQQRVAEFHAEVSAHAGHGGHDMYPFHRDWHQANPDPRDQLPAPGSPVDPQWGAKIACQRHRFFAPAAPGVARGDFALFRHQHPRNWRHYRCQSQSVLQSNEGKHR
jgi:hypothetical protein